jgi:hypothetical protein
MANVTVDAVVSNGFAPSAAAGAVAQSCAIAVPVKTAAAVALQMNVHFIDRIFNLLRELVPLVLSQPCTVPRACEDRGQSAAIHAGKQDTLSGDPSNRNEHNPHSALAKCYSAQTHELAPLASDPGPLGVGNHVSSPREHG